MKPPAFPNGVSAAAVNGCWQCHGSVVQVDPKTGHLDPATWPNTGIGRVNPDGSEGSGGSGGAIGSGVSNSGGSFIWCSC